MRPQDVKLSTRYKALVYLYWFFASATIILLTSFLVTNAAESPLNEILRFWTGVTLMISVILRTIRLWMFFREENGRGHDWILFSAITLVSFAIASLFFIL